MTTIVVYKSKTGFAKQYAEWIAGALEADLVPYKKVTVADLMAYDRIIYGGGLYAVGINGLKLIKKNLDKLSGKEIIVFAAGAAPGREAEIKEIKDNNFTAKEQKAIKFFYLRGGFDYSKLNLMDKLLMTLLKMKLKNKSDLTADERGMLNTYDKPADFTRKSNIDPLLTYLEKH